MNSDLLKDNLELHRLWLKGDGDECADFSGADLRGADLSGAILGGANLLGADLRGADLSKADLSCAVLNYAKLAKADLGFADLSDTNLRYADLTSASLIDANLRGARLLGAKLLGAKLTGTTGNMRHIKSLQLEGWEVAYTSDFMQIGCEQHPITEWWAFDDDRISVMGDGALEWWRKWKPILQKIIEASPAISTIENA